MNNFNSILLEGNLVRDPESRQTEQKVDFCKFTVATNLYYKKANDEYQQEVSYFDVVTYARLAETCASYLRKGRGVRVVGRLKQFRWQNEKGKPRSRVMIIAEHVEFRPRSGSGGVKD